MTDESPSKYGAPLTGSDWAGLPLRVGQIPDAGTIEDLHGDVDALLVWTGGPSHVIITYQSTESERAQHAFERLDRMIDLLPEGTWMHSVTWQGQPSVCIAVNFPPASLAALSSLQFPGMQMERGPAFGLVDPHIADLVLRLREQAVGKSNLGALYIQSLSLALASYVMTRHGQPRDSQNPTSGAGLSNQQRRLLVQFIEDEIEHNFGLLDLAQLVGYSPDHFSRLFKRSFGQSPHRFVLDRRVERAAELLGDESLSIAQVASMCGFCDQGHLTGAFKRRKGLTPGAYRKR